MCWRWILQGFAQYGQAHYGHGPIEGLHLNQKPDKSKQAGGQMAQPLVVPQPQGAASEVSAKTKTS